MELLQISLAAARVNAKLKQDEVAEKMHVSKTTIVNWERGKVMPSFADIQVLSTLYGIPADNIFYNRNPLKVKDTKEWDTE